MTITTRPDDSIFEFGPFVADPVLGRLSRQGVDVSLTRKAFQVLIALLEREGLVVSKRDLFKEVWPGIFVEDNNLARHVFMVRKALQDGGGPDEYIETIPGQGYRFAMPVRRTSRRALDHKTRSAERTLSPVWQWATATRTRAAAALLTTIALVIVGAIGLRWSIGPAARDERRLWRLTSVGMLDGDPTWSPDGRFLAYASDRSGNFDIWIQPVQEGDARRITSDPSRQWQPAWSPDGRYLAYRSEQNGGGLVVRNLDDGHERQLTTFGHRPKWSPDGSKLLFNGSPLPLARTAYLVDVNTGVISGAFPPGVDRPAEIGSLMAVAWHPAGRLSVYTRQGHAGAFWTIDLDGSRAVKSDVHSSVGQRLAHANVEIEEFVWSPAGDALYFVGRSNEAENIWRVDVDAETLAWIAGPERMTIGPGVERSLALSPDGRRLAFASWTERTRVWSFPFDAVVGRLLGSGEPLTPPGTDVRVLDLSNDGDLVYRTANRDRSELWLQPADRSDSHLLLSDAAAIIREPRWSRDGERLAYYRDFHESRGRIVLLNARDGLTRPLADSLPVHNMFDWTADGADILVGCRPNGRRKTAICITSADEARAAGSVRILATDPERALVQVRLSPSDAWVSFLAEGGSKTSVVFAMPLGGGAWVPISDSRWFADKPRWAPDGRTIYFILNRDGFWNLWGQRFDPEGGRIVGDAFQVSNFDSPSQMIDHRSPIQMGIAGDRIALPITDASGAVWILENLGH